MRPAVFLDRDNTIIHNDGDLGDPKRVVLMKGVAPAIASLRGLGFRIVVVTNQGGVARGLYSEDDVHAVHDRIARLVERQANGAAIDAFYYCPFHPKGSVEKYTREHPSRKPAPGMLLQAADELDLNLHASWMVGDQPRDIEAGHAAGTRTILLLDPTKAPPQAGEPGGPDYDAVDLVEAVRIIAQLRTPESTDESYRHRKPGEPRHRKWDAQRVAEIQKPRELPPVDRHPERGTEGHDKTPESSVFRPWAVGDSGADKPIATSPFRKRFFRDEEEHAAETATQDTAATVPVSPATTQPPAVAPTPPADPPPPVQLAKPIPDPVPISAPVPEPAPEQQERPKPKRKVEPPQAQPASESELASVSETDPKPAPRNSDKVLRMILQELRNQRGTSGEFSYLTIIAIVLQLVAIICLLGALWMGGADVAIFSRWLGAGLMIQLSVIATLMFGK